MTHYLTPEVVATRLSLSVVTVRRACSRGELEAFRPAGRWRITEEAVTEWLEGSKNNVRELKPSSRKSKVAPPTQFSRHLRALQSNTGGLQA